MRCLANLMTGAFYLWIWAILGGSAYEKFNRKPQPWIIALSVENRMSPAMAVYVREATARGATATSGLNRGRKSALLAPKTKTAQK